MFEIIVLTTENKTDCPIYKFNDWTFAGSFIQFQLQHGYSCEVSYAEVNNHDENR